MTAPASAVSAAESLARPKHPFGRRNTYLRPYIRHGLGYPTLHWEDSLTVKFKNLPPYVQRLYKMTLGFGLQDNDKRGNQRKEGGISRDHATALMVRCRELLLHGDRTLVGIFEALGANLR